MAKRTYGEEIRRLLDGAGALYNFLLKLAQERPSTHSYMNLRPSRRIVDSLPDLELVLPTLAQLTVALPGQGGGDGSGGFSHSTVVITGLSPRARVMPSK